MKCLTQSAIIQQIDEHLWIKREDLIPFSFGGNKARKAFLFFDDYAKGGYDCIVTYGSGASNHCRIVSNLCASKNIPCYIVAPLEKSHKTFNTILVNQFGAQRITVPVCEVKKTIDNTLCLLEEQGMKPYFIPGGGHGNLGTRAYVDCYKEILDWERKNGMKFDYIFLASGTGTTQAGLVCGQLLNGDNEKQIVGISIARPLSRGRDVILDSIKEYLGTNAFPDDRVVFLDDYICGGYGKYNTAILNTINQTMNLYGIPFDTTYTGKAFWGMKDYLNKNGIGNKNVLFIHTGGTPLFFNDML